MWTISAQQYTAARTHGPDNHCEFCFIYQLPPGLRSSLYLKDDDYRLSFLYGNFTTLTRFTEADLERVVDEGLSPLHVSIHATDPEVRSRMLRNRRGGTSLRWLRALLDHGITVHGQVVVCPGVNDAAVLDDTLAGVLDRYPELATLCVVPLGLSRYNREPGLRPHTVGEAAAVIDAVEDWQGVFRVLPRPAAGLRGRRVLPPRRSAVPARRRGPGLPDARGRHRDGSNLRARAHGRRSSGCDRAVPARVLRLGRRRAGRGLPRPRETRRPGRGFGSPLVGQWRCGPDESPVALLPSRRVPVGVLTGRYGGQVLRPLLATLGRYDVRVVEVPNEFFGGNTGVTGSMVGADLSSVLAGEPEGHRYLLPDVCLSDGRFLDGTTPAGLPRPVEVVPTDGIALRRALTGTGR